MTQGSLAGLWRARRTGFLVLLGGAVLFWVSCTGGEEAPPSTADPEPPKAMLVRTSAPAIEDVVDLADLPADLRPLRRAVLAAEVPGTVETVGIEEGQRVRTGQMIAEIDTRALEQAEAEAEALARQAEAQYRRAESLFERRSITRKDFDDAIANKEVADARLASARLNLDKSRVEAPWGGRVAVRHVEVGDYVLPGQPVAELVDVARLKVRAPAPAVDVPFLKVGAPATVRIDALPDETFQGQVVRLAAELDPDARTLDVEAEIPNPDGRLKPGMLARMEIPRRTVPGALLIPLEAVVDLGQRQVVYVVEDGLARRRQVELGPVIGRRVVVEAGLAPSDRVIVEGVQGVGDGQAVEPVAPEPGGP